MDFEKEFLKEKVVELFYKEPEETISGESKDIDYKNKELDVSIFMNDETTAYIYEVCSKEVVENIDVLNSNQSRVNMDNYKFVSHRKLLGNVIIFYKKSVRKLLRWYINPITIGYNTVFNYITSTFGRMNEIISYILGKQKTFDNEMSILSEDIKKIHHFVNNFDNELNVIKNTKDENRTREENAVKELFSMLESYKLEITEKYDAEITKLEEEIHNIREELKMLKTDNNENGKALLGKMNEQRNHFEERLITSNAQQELRFGVMTNTIQEYKNSITEYRNSVNEKLIGNEKFALENRLIISNDIKKLESEVKELAAIQKLSVSEDKNIVVSEISYSQAGEDRIVEYILRVLGNDMNNVRYLDVGANHYKEMSNSFLLYNGGAKGVLIEANPSLINELEENRSRDFVMNVGVTKEGVEELDFYVGNFDGISTFSKESIETDIERNSNIQIQSVVKVKTMTLQQIVENCFSKTPEFISLDIEGLELEVLSSFDFNKHRPQVLSVETIPYYPILQYGIKRSDIIDFMESVDYTEYAFTGINSIFIDKRKVVKLEE